ncbi:hypothetical protein [Planococcus koreensis]|uniref:hypothetical protein n=1 Tax=Planococcus koreensis TaxID=112331 RepID=UPI0039FDBE7C
MKIQIPNKHVVKTINFLYEMPLKGRQSRHRTKLVKLLDAHLVTVTDDERQLLKEHCHLNEEENPKTIEVNGQEIWDVKDAEAYSKDRTELLEELFILEGGAHEALVATVSNALEEYDGDLQGPDAVFYDVLCEVFESAQDEEQ